MSRNHKDEMGSSSVFQRLTHTERKAIYVNPKNYVRKCHREGQSVRWIADKLKAAGIDPALACSVVAELENDPPITARHEEKDNTRLLDILISVFAGIQIYLLLYLLFKMRWLFKSGVIAHIVILTVSGVIGNSIYLFIEHYKKLSRPN